MGSDSIRSALPGLLGRSCADSGMPWAPQVRLSRLRHIGPLALTAMSLPNRTNEAETNRGLLLETVATISRPARRLGRRGIHLAQRLLHPLRRRRALRRLNARPHHSILFVCYGNICRSPFGEVRLRELLKALPDQSDPDGPSPTCPAQVRSVGFVYPGRPSPERAQTVARELGVDLSKHRSNVLTPQLLQEADLILVMTAGQLRQLRWDYGRPDALHLGDLDPGPIRQRDIRDPYGHPEEIFREVYRRMDRILPVLIHHLRQTPQSTGSRTRSSGGGPP